jgi:hemerythrin-like domain-containing protein
MYAFIRMYRPHKAREDTVLFPALHSLLSASEYDELSGQFDQRERDLFGENGLERMVARVVKIEQSLGIYELSSFTPEVHLDGASRA